MYTIKQAATRTGVPVSLLRAWERRYGIVDPRRTPSGYRLYDDASIDRLRSMRTLVDSGWTPSAAAAAILAGSAPADARAAPLPRLAAWAPATDPIVASADDLIRAFVEAAVSVDAARFESALGRMFARGS